MDIENTKTLVNIGYVCTLYVTLFPITYKAQISFSHILILNWRHALKLNKIGCKQTTSIREISRLKDFQDSRERINNHTGSP